MLIFKQINIHYSVNIIIRFLTYFYNRNIIPVMYQSQPYAWAAAELVDTPSGASAPVVGVCRKPTTQVPLTLATGVSTRLQQYNRLRAMPLGRDRAWVKPEMGAAVRPNEIYFIMK